MTNASLLDYRRKRNFRRTPEPAGTGELKGGGFALTRIRDGRKPIWLLVKKQDEYAYAGDPVSTQPASVLSGRTLEQLGTAKSPTQNGHRGGRVSVTRLT